MHKALHSAHKQRMEVKGAHTLIGNLQLLWNSNYTYTHSHPTQHAHTDTCNFSHGHTCTHLHTDTHEQFGDF